MYRIPKIGSLFRAFLIPLGAAVAVSAVVASELAGAGAVFTTNQNGTFVNGNVYDDPNEPYLNGGPRANAKSCTAAGLPDGDYYFQVTDPSGSELLSTDDLDMHRRVSVFGGMITSYSGGHGTGLGRCGDVTVQLFPFLATSNPGDEYKVWMTAVGDYDPAGNGAFGFLPQFSKTDNFKVEVAAVIDTDGDGIPDVDDNCPDEYDPSNTCYF